MMDEIYYSIFEKNIDELNFVQNLVTNHCIIVLSIKLVQKRIDSQNIKALEHNSGSLNWLRVQKITINSEQKCKNKVLIAKKIFFLICTK
jgi:hypothetical protein